MRSCLRLPAAIRDQIITHARNQVPLECCGILAGVGESVSEVFEIENELRSPVRFRMNPAGQWAAMQAIFPEREMTAIYHSHPDGPPHPSPTDLAEHSYPESAVVILSRNASGAWNLHAYEIMDGQAHAIPVMIEPA